MKYYRLIDDVYYPNRWYLGDIVEIADCWQFVYGKTIDESLLKQKQHIKIYQEGDEIDYTTNGAYSIPIVSELIKNQLAGISALQFIPIAVEGTTISKYNGYCR